MPAPAQDARDVLGGLALADLDGVGAQVDGVPTQLKEALSFQTPVRTLAYKTRSSLVLHRKPASSERCQWKPPLCEHGTKNN